MLNFLGPEGRLCDRLSRRHWLHVGGLAALGVTGGQLLASRAAAGIPRNSGGRAKSCIVLLMLGGPPQYETWDPKPHAPAEIRGPFGPINTNVPGIDVCELMPQTARHMDKIAVLRGLATGDNAHSTGGYAMSTGRPHAPRGVEFAKPGAPNDWPCLGAVVKHLRPQVGLPAAFTIPEIAANDGNKTWPGQDAGWLGRSSDPWILDCDPSQPKFDVPNLALPTEVPALRFDGRRSLLEQLDRRMESIDGTGLLDSHNTWQKQAMDLLHATEARNAFNLAGEPEALRDRYGRNRWGQSVLLARRLVEAGVSLVQVNWTRIQGAPNNGHWDTHTKNAESVRDWLCPRMEQGYTALLEDLAQRGLLDETLVVWVGEMGRTPKINGNGGRDHWGNVQSVALAGGGVRGGTIYGSSDRQGAEPHTGKIGPADFAATIFHALGYRPDTSLIDFRGRPNHISEGKVVHEVF